MVMRVATFGLTSSLLSQSLATQAKLAEKTNQQVSGVNSTDYAGLGTDATRMVGLEVAVTRSEAYQSAGTLANTRIEAMYSATDSMVDLLTQMRAEVSAASLGEDSTTLQSTAASLLEEFTALINTQSQGRYLFAGSMTGEPPASTEGYEATSLTDVNTGYYSGDENTASVAVSESWTIDYGISGGNDALEKAMRALSYLANADTLDSQSLTAAADLLVEAQDGISSLQVGLSLAASSIERAITSEEEFTATAEELIAEINTSDTAVLAVMITSYNTQLEASYSALGTLSSLSLMDYLR
ncbi:flagellin [Breoghania sp. L-A4]|uniref:flagellin n=1 Tax=Breoghania sp. L-A4 TaxID=2304600 RepID=UPI000E35A401|nr:flagellin [Breoghania sp. L-A4]AXS41587.1 flagellin [Breoghania sp. L-A4]